ncbi:LOW QUALITY PROTEIN: hypothetical protein V2J09_006071 [Rumex salicifolius]
MLGGQRAIILKRWKIGMELDLPCLTEVPIWITLPNLDVRVLYACKIGSAVGTSVLTDFNSAHQEKLSFARVMVEISPSIEIIRSIEFHGEDGKIIQQDIIYNWLLTRCPKCQIIRKENGLFVFHSDKEEDPASILERGPWMLGGQRSIILRRWKIGMELDLSCLTEVPIWITLPNLDVRFWSEDMLAKIGFVVGTSVLTDFNSAHQEKLSFARVMVEIAPSAELIKSIEFQGEDGEIIQQDIIYN